MAENIDGRLWVEDVDRLCLHDPETGQRTPAAVREAGGLGLRGMEERAEEIGGRWAVESSPGTGTRVRIVVPTPRA